MFTPGLRGCAYKTASGLGKWPNRDPLDEKGGINLYQFVQNNPIGYADAFGFCPDCNAEQAAVDNAKRAVDADAQNERNDLIHAQHDLEIAGVGAVGGAAGLYTDSIWGFIAGVSGLGVSVISMDVAAQDMQEAEQADKDLQRDRQALSVARQALKACQSKQ